MEEAIVAYLLADSTLSALVSTRVFPLSRLQGSALPAVTYQRISGAPLYADDGEVGLTEARLQVDTWAETYSTAKTAARAVIDRLSAVRDVTQSGVTFRYIMLDDERDFREEGSNAAQYLYRVSMDFLVWLDT